MTSNNSNNYDVKEIMEEVREDLKEVSSGVAGINSHLSTLNSKVARNVNDIERERRAREALAKVVYRGGGIVITLSTVAAIIASIISF